MSSVIVTGGAGFIGSHLVDELIRKTNYKVIVIDDLSSGKRENINPKASFYKMNISSSKLDAIFKKEKPLYVFHLAAQIDVRKSVADPMHDVKINIIGSLNLIEFSRKYKVKKFVFASTGGAIYPEEKVPAKETTVEEPVSPYGINKLAIDKYLNYYHKVFGLRYTSLRFANVFGPRQDPHGEAGVVAIFINKFLDNKSPTKFGEGRQTRDYIYVKDVVGLAMKSYKSKNIGVYNVGTCRETSLNQLIKIIKKVGGFTLDVKKDPAKKGEAMRSCLINVKARKDFGWKPNYTLEDGLRETVQWFRDRHESKRKESKRMFI